MAAERSKWVLNPFAISSHLLLSLAILPLVILVLQCNLSIGKKIESDTIPKLDELVVPVEHALIKEISNGEEEFKPRGTITLRSLKHKSAVFHQNDNIPREDLQTLRKMAQTDAYYRIRVPARFGSTEDIYVSTYVKACALYHSKLTETITISVDHMGNIYGVGLRLPVSQCKLTETITVSVDHRGNVRGVGFCLPGSQCDERFTDLPSHFNTTVQVLQQTTGALPDTQTYVQRLEKEKTEQAAGKGKDNRSFLAKYWMYIVPVVIFMLMTSQQPDQQGEGEGS